MADVEDWQPVAQQQPAPADDWQPVGEQRPQPDLADASGMAPGEVPEAFLERSRVGQAVNRVMARMAKDAQEGFGGDSTPTSLSDETFEHLIQAGVFHDPARGRPGALQLMNEATILPLAKLWDGLGRSISGGLYGAGGLMAQLYEELGGEQGMAERARRETINFGNWAMIETGFGGFVRPYAGVNRMLREGVERGGRELRDQVVGRLPEAQDFKAAAAALDAPAAEANLQRLWQEKGIHPAEAVADAERDTWLRHQITAPIEAAASAADDAKVADIISGRAEGEIPLRAAGAEVTTDPPLVSPADMPLPRPASLSTAFHEMGATLTDIGRDMQMLVAPMAAGSKAAMAMAKDFANALRRNRWEWARYDQDIAKRFDPEARKRMWDAADEESVLRQEGKTSEHMGLATLSPEERAAVEDLQARAQLAWGRARDLGMVEGEGLPAYTPRMVINAAAADEPALPLNVIGRNLRISTPQLRRRKHMMAEETEAAAKERLGEGAVIARDIRALPLATAKLEDAVAGRTLVNGIRDYGKAAGTETVVEGGIPAGAEGKWFTMDHPALKTWRPDLVENPVTGKWEARTDDAGNVIFKQVPLYVHGDFEGPLRAVLTHKSGLLYGGLMSLKGKTMSLIMNSPLIHNAVEWGRAMPAMPGKVATFKVYFEGNRAKNDVGVMREAIDAGLVPIGKRFFNQDITSIMEEPNLQPGRSWTAQVLGFVPGLFDAEAGAAVKRTIDKAGDFWHNTLLWDRVGDLQMGLYTNFRNELVGKGVDAQTASRAAAHWANRYAGALPQEAMSDAARKTANMLLFSRSFTLGNLGVMKDMLTGLPKDALAQIERDAGVVDPKAVGYAKSLARRKAAVVVALDIGLMYVGNSLLQSAINVLRGDHTLDQEMRGYADRMAEALKERGEHPLKLLQPFDFLGHVSSTYENEPGKQDRLRVGTAANGTAIYARNPVGKIGEEFMGYLTGPLDMIRRKLGTIARPGWQIMANDKGFGRKVYDPDADTAPKYLRNVGLIAAHFFGSQLPEGQINAAADLVKGEGDSTVNALGAFGPVAGVTFSKGAPGGPAVGELYHARAQHQYAVDAALPDIRRQIQRGDLQGAQERMTELGIPPGLQRFYTRTTLYPETRLNGKTLRDFYLYGTPEQKARMERARGVQ